MKKEGFKNIFMNLIIIAVLLAVIFFVFRKDYKEILSCIKSISPAGLLVLFGMELLYLFFDSAACYILVRSQFPFFKFRQAAGVIFLGLFGNAAAFSAGIIPLQSYYLYKKGIEVGNTVGLMNLKYIFHKSAIFAYAAVMLFTGRKWVGAAVPDLMKYIYTGFGVCAAIIGVLILACTLQIFQRLLLRLTEKLPDTDKWTRRKKLWADNLRALYAESKDVLKNKGCCIRIISVNAVKLLWFYTIPFVCIKVLGFSGLSFWQTQALASIMLLIMGVLPNIAGIGPAEFAFIMLFSPFLGKIEASSALILYRAVTYFFPFILSIFVTLRIRKTAG